MDAPGELRRVEAIVAGDILIPGLPAKALERLRRKLLLKNHEWMRTKRRTGETGSIPEWLDVLFEEPDGSVRVPRGATELVRASLAEDLLRPRYVDQRAWGEPLVFDEDLHAVARLARPPRYYQEDIAAEAERALQGTVVVPCAGGKTTAGALTIARLRRTAIVLVHTEDLLDQWVATIRTWLGIEPGTVLAGAIKPGAVTVAMVITLARHLEGPDGEAFGRRFGVAIVDECHHAPAPETFQRALRKLPARVRIGLTATPDREDGMTELMDWSFGPRLVEIDTKTLFDRGWLTAPTVELVPSTFRFTHWRTCRGCNTRFAEPRTCTATGRPCDPGPAHPKDETRRLAKMQKALVLDPARNALIADLAAREWKAGETILVLSNHKGHCRALGRMCWERGAEAVVLVASKTKGDKLARKETLAGMREGKVRLVIATSLADEGLDIERLSRVILALPERARARTSQRLGRLMRNWPGKKPKLYDVTDPHVETLENRAAERMRVYRKLGLAH